MPDFSRVESVDPIVFGPVPWRRLGRSPGIDDIPPMSCSHSCGYCQVGRTLRTAAEPRGFHPVDLVMAVRTQRFAAAFGGTFVTGLITRDALAVTRCRGHRFYERRRSPQSSDASGER